MKHNTNLQAILLASFTWSVTTLITTIYIFFIPAKFGFGTIATGAVFSLNFTGVLLGSVLYPKLRRRTSILTQLQIISYTSIVALIFGAVFISNPIIVIPATAIIFMMGSMLSILNRQLIASYLPDDLRKHGFTYSYSIMSVGAIAISIIGPALFNYSIDTVRYMYLAIAIAQYLTYLLFKHVINNPIDSGSDADQEMHRFKISKLLLVVLCLLFFAIFQVTFLIPKTVENTYTMTIYSLYLVVHTGLSAVCPPFINKLLDNVSNQQKITIAGFLLLISFAIFPIHGIGWMILATCLFTIGQVTVYTNLDLLLIDIYGDKVYADALVKIRIITQLLEIVTPVIIGAMLTGFGTIASFGLIIITLIIFLITYPMIAKKLTA